MGYYKAVTPRDVTPFDRRWKRYISNKDIPNKEHDIHFYMYACIYIYTEVCIYMVTRSAAPPLPPPSMVYGPGWPPSCGMEWGVPLPPVGWLWGFWV